jgi:hypothetical protein
MTNLKGTRRTCSMHELIARRTTSTLCWSVPDQAVPVEIYVAGWRTPNPVPARIRVTLWENGEAQPSDSEAARRAMSGEERALPLTVRLVRKKNGAAKARFDPEGKPSDWPIGGFEVPRTMLADGNAKELTLRIDWS